jgi:hypothetical protein
MWPGIRPATGWIAYFTSTPPLLQDVPELVEVLAHGHTILLKAGRYTKWAGCTYCLFLIRLFLFTQLAQMDNQVVV